jgi:uncharacterized radical SAM superfamily Fe-S cluster-containing enzyme
MERCNFACTACYLADEANATPPLPFDDVRAQLDQIRAELGPWGNTQITAGEVTLLPVDELLRILRYAREIQLSPMLMTNGQVLLEDPRYLERLVVDGGLDNLAIHIDTTQRGRHGMARGASERDLMPLRDAFAELVRSTRRRTRRPLHAAHTFTVTADNLGEVADVVRWTLRNADAFRLLSLQPTASVGRTRASRLEGGRERLWSAVCDGLGVHANDSAWQFGHPRCNNIALLFAVSIGQRIRVVEVTRANAPLDRWFFRRLLSGGLAGFRPGGEPARVWLMRLAGRLARHPRLLLEVPFFCGYRAWTERALLARLVAGFCRLERCSVRPFAVVVHHFMDSAELSTDEGRARLQACAFRVPVDGEMVSMCELNGGGRRRELNLRNQVRIALEHASGREDPRTTAVRSSR